MFILKRLVESRSSRLGRLKIKQFFFDPVQTPTIVTNAIMASIDPFQAYRDYVLEYCLDYEEPIYAEDDVFCLEDPIGLEIRNDGPEHVKRFDDWLKSVEEAGYDVEAVAW